MRLLDKDRFLTVIDSTPLVSIDLVITRSDHRVLLGRRRNAPAKDYWFVPGGRIVKNETLAAALSRIAKVETGLLPGAYEASLLGVYEHIYDDNAFNVAGINTHYVVIAHSIRTADDWEPRCDEQHAEMKWWRLEDLCRSSEVHENTRAYFIDTHRGAE